MRAWLILLLATVAACQPIAPCETDACLAYRASIYRSYMMGQHYNPVPFYQMPVTRPTNTNCQWIGNQMYCQSY